MKLIVSAFWVEDEDLEAAMRMLLESPAVKGAGSSCSFTEEVAWNPQLRAELRNFSLTEAADYYPGPTL